MPDRQEVQLATFSEEVPSGPGWLHEIKLDGYRLLCRIENGRARLFTRRQLDWTHRYQRIASAAAELPVNAALIDGELVALLPSGVSSFQALQNAGKPGSDTQLIYCMFDLLYLDGYDWRLADTNVWKVERMLLDYPHRRIRTSDRRFRDLRKWYRAYRTAHNGRKPIDYRGRERWTEIPAEFL